MSLRYYQFLLACLPLLGQTACAQPESTAVVEGRMVLHPDWGDQLYLLHPASFTKVLASYEMPVVDTIAVDADGFFRLEKHIPDGDAGLYILVSQPRHSRFANALEELPFRENYLLIDLQPGHRIELEASIDRLTHSVQYRHANAETRAMQELQEARMPLVDQIEAEWLANGQGESFQWNVHGNDTVAAKVHLALDAYLDTATALLPVMVALRLRAPGHDYRDRPEFFISVADRMESLYPGHPWCRELKAHLHPDHLPVLAGERMPDFALPTPQGDTLHLSDVQGKLIIVDFWASWCAPCRKEVRGTLRPLYDRYHSRGLTILGITIDSDRDSWLNAIEKDGAIWQHAGDLLGDASPVRESLKFDTIPACYILDEQGRLLARNLHGEELRGFVEAFFRDLAK
ncbi:MAG: TlpA family protein disulfide reductase [Lewinellaceae bacterium]|nr:TlpA family protein disulfide reductase [Saprospiraceae bacterium]MCB9313251.1 TlpA family protein disulfide reductase [Lewinellaceae bacterium]